jgi:hypothetical protein
MQLACQPSEQTKGLLSQVQLLRNMQLTCRAQNGKRAEAPEDSIALTHRLVSARERANCLRAEPEKPQNLTNNNVEQK